MIKRTNKADIFFITTLMLGLVFHLSLIWAPHRLFDETFYATVPYRLIIGDSLVQHEWHLTQFSSLFLYLPVRIWLFIKGSTDGIYLYLRFVYIFAHTAVTATAYSFFRKYGIWSALAAIMFYLLIPYKTYALSYTSMLVIFYLLFTLSLISIYRNHSVKSYIASGFFFGCCCVNNPIFCIFFAFYLILCALWLKKEILINLLSNFYIITHIAKNNPKKTRKKAFERIRNTSVQKKTFLTEEFRKYNCFFDKRAITYSVLGISIMAVISIAFFYFTGGSVPSIFENIDNLLHSSEYFTTSKGAWIQKSFDYTNAINAISLQKPFLAPVFFLILLVDKNRKNNSHRVTYLFTALILSVLFFAGIFNAEENTAFFYSLPFAFFSFVCYILANTKQTDLFFCIWCPCAAAALLCSIASNTLFFSSSAICSISNIVGVFFAHNLFNEIITEHHNEKGNTTVKNTNKIISALSRVIIIVSICLQIAGSCFFAQDYMKLEKGSTIKATSGPLKGMYYNEEAYSLYENSLNFLDYIKENSNEDDPILLIGNLNWVYMYADRPFGTHSAYYLELNKDTLSKYYEQNPDKIPKYICILTVRTPDYIRYAVDILEEDREVIDSMFEYTEEHLSGNILLTVTDYIYDRNVQN